MNDNMPLHFLSSAIAGFTAVVIGSPVDVVKTRIMNANPLTGQAYKGLFDCVYRTLTEEGVTAFYKGFIPNAGRIISWNIVMFVTLQQIRLFIY